MFYQHLNYILKALCQLFPFWSWPLNPDKVGQGTRLSVRCSIMNLCISHVHAWEIPTSVESPTLLLWSLASTASKSRPPPSPSPKRPLVEALATLWPTARSVPPILTSPSKIYYSSRPIFWPAQCQPTQQSLPKLNTPCFPLTISQSLGTFIFS